MARLMVTGVMRLTWRQRLQPVIISLMMVPLLIALDWPDRLLPLAVAIVGVVVATDRTMYAVRLDGETLGVRYITGKWKVFTLGEVTSSIEDIPIVGGRVTNLKLRQGHRRARILLDGHLASDRELLLRALSVERKSST